MKRSRTVKQCSKSLSCSQNSDTGNWIITMIHQLPDVCKRTRKSSRTSAKVQKNKLQIVLTPSLPAPPLALPSQELSPARIRAQSCCDTPQLQDRKLGQHGSNKMGRQCESPRH